MKLVDKILDGDFCAVVAITGRVYGRIICLLDVLGRRFACNKGIGDVLGDLSNAFTSLSVMLRIFSVCDSTLFHTPFLKFVYSTSSSSEDANESLRIAVNGLFFGVCFSKSTIAVVEFMVISSISLVAIDRFCVLLVLYKSESGEQARNGA